MTYVKFYSKVILFIFFCAQEIIFFNSSFTEFELLVFHNNIENI